MPLHSAGSAYDQFCPLINIYSYIYVICMYLQLLTSALKLNIYFTTDLQEQSLVLGTVHELPSACKIMNHAWHISGPLVLLNL